MKMNLVSKDNVTVHIKIPDGYKSLG